MLVFYYRIQNWRATVNFFRFLNLKNITEKINHIRGCCQRNPQGTDEYSTHTLGIMTNVLYNMNSNFTLQHYHSKHQKSCSITAMKQHIIKFCMTNGQ